MAKQLVNKDDIREAVSNLRMARKQLINDGNCIVTRLISVQTQLSSSEVWQGVACDEFTRKLGAEINRVTDLDKILLALISHCEKVDDDLESYVRYIQSLFGRDF